MGKSDTTKAAKRIQNSVLYPGVFIQDGYIMVKDDPNQDPYKIARAIQITSVLVDIDTGEISYILAFKYRNQLREIAVKRGDFRKNKIVNLLAFGVDVFEHNATQIIKHLRNEEQQIKESYVHQNLGWGLHEGKLVFKHFEGIGITSRYNGNKDIEPKGSYEVWKKIVSKHVMGNINLELALLIGLSSASVGLIGMTVPLDSLIVHIYGNSSQGKTTATSLAISPFGNPDTKGNGLMTTWSATNNAIAGNLSGNFGLVVGFDEISMSDEKNFSSMIYRLGGGKDKGRMDKEAVLKNTGKWQTTLISNGEFSMMTKVNQNAGIRVRLYEFGNIEWTRDAKSADDIKDTVMQNYGQAGPIFAKRLLEIGREQVVSNWKSWTIIVLDAISNKSHFSSRISSKLAILMLTGEIAREALGLNFNLDEILKILIQNEQTGKEELDLGTKAFNYFSEKFSQFRSNFIHLKTDKPVSVDSMENRQVYGSVTIKHDCTIVSILPSIFHEWMKECGFEEPKIILREWKGKGILDCEGDRYTRKRKIHLDVATQVYSVKIMNDASESR
jgi:putative DNA primase/helicase